MKSAAVILAFLSLTACDSMDLPHVFGGNEVPPEVLAQPRVVTTPAQEDINAQSWMRLGDVPRAPNDFTSETLITQSMQQMRNDRTQADKLKQEADMPPPVTQP